MRLSIAYITANSSDQAWRIGRTLVQARLAACVNVIPGMNSIYWWEGEIQEDAEMIVIAKTRESLLPKLIETVKSVHSYDCPCIIAVPVLGGNPDYLDWIGRETAPSAEVV
jgi:periplasmic divalent cation tolerance protein